MEISDTVITFRPSKAEQRRGGRSGSFCRSRVLVLLGSLGLRPWPGPGPPVVHTPDVHCGISPSVAISGPAFQTRRLSFLGRVFRLRWPGKVDLRLKTREIASSAVKRCVPPAGVHAGLGRPPLPGLAPSPFLPSVLSASGPATPPGPLHLPPDNAASGHEACSCDGGARPPGLFRPMGSEDTGAGRGWLARPRRPAVSPPRCVRRPGAFVRRPPRPRACPGGRSWAPASACSHLTGRAPFPRAWRKWNYIAPHAAPAEQGAFLTEPPATGTVGVALASPRLSALPSGRGRPPEGLRRATKADGSPGVTRHLAGGKSSFSSPGPAGPPPGLRGRRRPRTAPAPAPPPTRPYVALIPLGTFSFSS